MSYSLESSFRISLSWSVICITPRISHSLSEVVVQVTSWGTVNGVVLIG